MFLQNSFLHHPMQNLTLFGYSPHTWAARLPLRPSNFKLQCQTIFLIQAL